MSPAMAFRRNWYYKSVSPFARRCTYSAKTKLCKDTTATARLNAALLHHGWTRLVRERVQFQLGHVPHTRGQRGIAGNVFVRPAQQLIRLHGLACRHIAPIRVSFLRFTYSMRAFGLTPMVDDTRAPRPPRSSGRSLVSTSKTAQPNGCFLIRLEAGPNLGGLAGHRHGGQFCTTTSPDGSSPFYVVPRAGAVPVPAQHGA